MRIYLVGFMACGKTTVGKRLAKLLNCQFIDTDELFEQQENISIEHFFHLHGETKFREIETQIVRQTDQNENIVVALGGGSPLYGDNMQWLLKNGIVVYIQLTAKCLYDRLRDSKKIRPFVLSARQNLLEETTQLLTQREPTYLQAHITVKGLSAHLEKVILTACDTFLN
ncbi:MAG: shikimate kinase [Bacteroidales bacterium]|nr:shikimate kinase [Bacteroidales bacterium]